MTETSDLITRLDNFPQNLRKLVGNLSKDKKDLKIINWPISTTINHICDSHINSYIRIKMALTESTPTIKPYDESSWVTLADIKASIDVSLSVIDGIHKRICLVLRSLKPEGWQKNIYPSRTFKFAYYYP